jgi:hypothetical protein
MGATRCLFVLFQGEAIIKNKIHQKKEKNSTLYADQSINQSINPTTRQAQN